MKFKHLLPLLSLLTLLSCSKPQGFDYKDMKNFKVANWGMDKTTVSMDLVFFNPNNYGVDLRHIDSDISINNTYLGKFVLDTLMRIPAHSDFVMPATMEVDMKNVFKNALTTLFSNEVLFAAKGSTKVGKGGIFINVPFNYQARHKVSLF